MGENKSIGIIGGMGPMATCDLFRKIIDVEEADSDQEHVRVFIDSNTQIPDRTAAILEGGENPVSKMIRSALSLEKIGADILIMPCNTAHYFYNEIQAEANVPVINMLQETAAYIKRNGITTVGLLATDGTILAEVYDGYLEAEGITVLKPDQEGQKAVMGLIYDGVKAGRYSYKPDDFLAVVADLQDRGAESMILGCTELPIAADMYHFDFPYVDPTEVLAESAVLQAGGRLRKGH